MKKHLKLEPRRIIKTGKEMFATVKQSFWKEMMEGLKYLFTQREIRTIIYMLYVLLGAAGAIYVVIIVFVQESFGSVTKHLGVLAVALGAGLFAGALAYGRFGKNEAWYNTIYLCLIAGGTMLMAFALIIHFYPIVPVAMALAFLLGMMIGPIFIASNTIVQLVSNESMRGKVFSALEIVIHASFLLTMMLSSWVSEHVDKIWIILTVGFSVVWVGVFGYVDVKRKGGLALGDGKMS